MDTHEYFRKKYNDPDHPTSSEEKDQKKR